MKCFSKLCLAFLLFLLVNSLPAQPVLYIGAQAGPAVPNMIMPATISALSLQSSGRQFGLFLRYGKRPYYQLSFNWANASEMMQFDQKDRGLVQEQISLRQFSISGIMGYNLLNKPAFKLRSSMGPQLGYTHIEAPAFLPGGGDPAQQARLSWLLGAGIDLYHFNIDLTYQLGLDPLLPFEGPKALQVRMNMLALGIGVHI